MLGKSFEWHKQFSSLMNINKNAGLLLVIYEAVFFNFLMQFIFTDIKLRKNQMHNSKKCPR